MVGSLVRVASRNSRSASTLAEGRCCAVDPAPRRPSPRQLSEYGPNARGERRASTSLTRSAVDVRVRVLVDRMAAAIAAAFCVTDDPAAGVDAPLATSPPVSSASSPSGLDTDWTWAIVTGRLHTGHVPVCADRSLMQSRQNMWAH